MFLLQLNVNVHLTIQLSGRVAAETALLHAYNQWKQCTTFSVSLTFNFIMAELFSTTEPGLRTQSLILRRMEAAEEELKLKQLSAKRLPHQLKCIQTHRAGIPKANFHRTMTQIALGRKLPVLRILLATKKTESGGNKDRLSPICPRLTSELTVSEIKSVKVGCQSSHKFQFYQSC